MKELFLTRDRLANKISFYHLAVFLVSLPFDRFYSHLVLISFAIHTLIQFNKAALKPIFTWQTLALQSVFFVTVVSTIYASNKSLAFRDWELDVTIFLIPVLFCLNPFNLKKYRSQLLLLFSVGSALAILYLFINAITTIRYYRMPLSALFSPAFTNHNFAEPINMHATFFSLQMAVALIYILSALIKETRGATRIFYALTGLLLLAGIIQLSSKSVFAALFLTINFAFPFFLLNGVRRLRFMIVSASLSVLILAVIYNSGAFRDRYLNELRDDFSRSSVSETVEPRMVRWQIAVGMVNKSPVVGYGAGSEIPLLQEKYFEKKFYNSYLHRLNAHNEYLSFLIKSGIWGLAVYLATLVYGFRMAVRKKDIVFFGFMMLLAIVSLSENILDADKGVVFYSFFFPFFVFTCTQKDHIEGLAKRHKNLRKVATNHVADPSLV